MNRDETLSRVYLVTGVVALIGMWSAVIVYVWRGGTPWTFGRDLVANPAVTMLTIEMACMAVASSLMMYSESRRLQMRGASIVLFLALTVGFGVVFPLFLFRRQRRLTSGTT